MVSGGSWSATCDLRNTKRIRGYPIWESWHKTTKPDAITGFGSKCDKGAGKANVFTWGDLPLDRKSGNPDCEVRLDWQGSAEAIVPGVFREGLNNERMSTVSSLRNEQGRQKLSDRETGEQTKQVKPVGDAQRAESFPAQDNGKSAGRVWEAVFARENKQTALKRVESNKGAAGIDGMKVTELRGYLKAHRLEVRGVLERGEYQPSRVRRVEIPKPDGGVRQLGIPTVQDRLIQQAIAQVLTPMFEAVFSPPSYGYRPGRSAHQAVEQS